MSVVACSEMLFRAPVSAVFRAFVQPAWLKQFWLKSASGPLTEGGNVRCVRFLGHGERHPDLQDERGAADPA
jgi:uncharacterized protein YndB with AHSA1/START domain